MRSIGIEIKKRRERIGWTRTKLATLAGISQSFLSRIEAGTHAGSWETYIKIAGALGVSTDVFLTHKSNVEDAPLGWRRIPILDYAQAATWTGVETSPNDGPLGESVMTDLEHPPSSFAMRIKGNSMEPEFREGDIVVINPILQPQPGDYVVATDERGEATFKQYRSGGINERGDTVFELHPLNQFYGVMRSDRQALAIVGVMVEHHRYRKVTHL